MVHVLVGIGTGAGSRVCGTVQTVAFCLTLAVGLAGSRGFAEDPPHASGERAGAKALADERLREPLGAIREEYRRRTGSQITLSFLPAPEVDSFVGKRKPGYDVAFLMSSGRDEQTAVSSLSGASIVAWKYPSGEPVWAAPLTGRPEAARFIRFAGGPTGHRLWSESEAGFTIVSGKNAAEAHAWVVEHRVGHTYPSTAVRMLRECGGPRDGICIDVGCGSGALEVELARRSNLSIIGLDIDPDAQPLFEKRMRQANLEDRARFVLGDAQDLPFPDDYADMIVSRGTLTFIPDVGKCLREVDRVLKPTGVAFLGGRYLYTPQKHKISTEKLRQIVRQTKIPGAQVIDARGQWVKIVGPQAPQSARGFRLGPGMLATRFVADYAITEGKCLLICLSDGGGQQALQQGFLDTTDLEITALYPSEELTVEARKRIRAADLAGRVTCATGGVGELPFGEASFDVVAGVGPIVLGKDRKKSIREIYRVLRPGGAALVGGRYLHMPEARRVSSETLRASAAETGIPSIRVYDDAGQWVEIRKGIQDLGPRD